MKSNCLLTGLKNRFEKTRQLLSVFFVLCLLMFVNVKTTFADYTLSNVIPFDMLDGGLNDDDGLANDTFTVIGNFTIDANGKVDGSDVTTGSVFASAFPVIIRVTGNFTILSGGEITTQNDTSSGDGGLIDISAGGNITIEGGGVATASKVTGGGTSGNGGPINLHAGGNISLLLGSIVASADAGGGHAGTIRITAEGLIFIEGLISAGPDTNVVDPGYLQGFVLESGNTTQKGGKIFIVSHATCSNGPAVTIGTEAIVVSQGQDPASDTVSIEGCGILVKGLVASVSKKLNGSTGNSPYVELRSGGEIVVNGQDLGNIGPNQGRVRADVVIGENEVPKYVKMYAKNNITVLGPDLASGDIFSVSSNGGYAQNAMVGGNLSLISLNGGISLSGLALQADGGGYNGSFVISGGAKGGTIDVQAKLDVNLNGAALYARGAVSGTDPDGGDVSVRSFSLDILSNTSSIINVNGGNPINHGGTVVLTSCDATLGFPDGTIVPAVVVASKTTSSCATPEPSLPVGTTPLPSCGTGGTFQITGTDIVCPGQTTQFCAPAADHWLWTGPAGATFVPSAIAQCVTVSAVGTYTVTITFDGNNCGGTATKSLTNYTPPTLTAIPTQPSCFGQTGSVTLTPSGGIVPYTLSGDATTGLGAGTYSYTVTDGHSCPGTATATINAAPPELFLTAIPTQPTCAVSTGSVALTPSGGTPAYTITGPATTGLPPGTYTYTVTDSKGCPKTASATINNAPNAPSLTATPTNPNCFGGTGTVALSASGGTPAYTFSGAATTGLGTGTYAYTVTDALGCKGSATASIVVPPQLSITATPTNPTCTTSTGSVSLSASGGTPAYTFSGAATTGLSAGTYSYTVTDSKGCTKATTATLIPAGSLTCSITGNLSFCSGGSTQLCAQANMDNYVWKNSSGTTVSTIQCLTVTAAGTYTVTITKGGCIKTCTACVTTKSVPSCNISANCGSICQGQTASLCAPSGTNYQYLWSTGAVGRCINVTTAGPFTVRVTNGYGCSSTCTKSITVNPPPPCNITGCTVICSGQSTTICAPYTSGCGYSWRYNTNSYPCSYSRNCTATQGGTYTVTVTDANGCKSICTKTVTTSTYPSCTITGNTNICQGQTTQLCGPTGTGYTYRWSPGNSTLQCITVSTAGTYSLTVTNAAGCSKTCDKTVCVYPAPSCNITGNCTNICSGRSTCLYAPSGCSSYTWLHNNSHSSYCNVYSGGTYQCRVTNSYGCSTTGSRTVSYTSCRERQDPGPANLYTEKNLTVSVYPNPFTLATTIEFQTGDEAKYVVMEVYNVAGSKIAVLYDGIAESNTIYPLTFDGTDLPDGIYLYKLIADDQSETGRITLMK